MGRTVLAAPVAAALVLAAAACSSSHSSKPPTTTTVAGAASTTAAASTTTGAAPTTTTPTTATGATTTTVPRVVSVRITNFRGPNSPVECNAPTSIDLSWTASGATAVDLTIDGQKFASYPSGAQHHLEPLACDGKSHTYTVSAHAGGELASSSLTIASKPI